MSYLLRRLGFYAIAAWASLTLNFLLPRLMPGDPTNAILARFQGRLDPAALESMKQAYGVTDAPLYQQYGNYLANTVQGDLGISISYFPTRVWDVIGTGLGWTVLLGGVALLLSVLIGNVLGVVAAWRRGGFVDSVMPPLLSFVGSFPYFWLAALALFFLAFRWDLFPLNHAYTDALTPEWSLKFIGSVLTHLVLPAGSIVIVSIGGWMIGMRNTMIATLAEDYIAMAEAKGLSQRRIMFNYAARNALLPTMTAFGMSFGFLISGALLTEIVFSYPGLGYQLITAVRGQDYPLMQGIFLMITFAVLGANLLVDVLYVRMDPRVRVG